MTPKQEASKFLCNRANLLRESERCAEALEAIDAAERFNPVNPACAEIRFSILDQMQGRLFAQPLPAGPELTQVYIDAGTEAMLNTLAGLISRGGNVKPPRSRSGGNGDQQKR